MTLPEPTPTLDYARPGLRPKWLRRFEWRLAIPLVALTWLVFKTHMPQGPVDLIGFAAAVLIAWLMTFNSFRVRRTMNPLERLLLAAWFPLITILTLVVLASAFTTRGFADR